MFVAFEVSNVVTSMVVRDLQPLNMLDMLEMFAVLKCERSKEPRDSHCSNMPDAFHTRSESNDVMFKEVRALQPANILSMRVTFSVLKNDRSRDVREEQPLNR